MKKKKLLKAGVVLISAITLGSYIGGSTSKVSASDIDNIQSTNVNNSQNDDSSINNTNTNNNQSDDSSINNTNTNNSQSDDNDDSNNDLYYIYDNDILDYLQNNDSEAYSKIPQDIKDEADNDDMYRQGGTYIQYHKNYLTIYLNSACVKIVQLAGGAAVASLIATAGFSAGVSAGLAAALGGAIADIPNSKGVWLRVNYEGHITKVGLQ